MDQSASSNRLDITGSKLFEAIYLALALALERAESVNDHRVSAVKHFQKMSDFWPKNLTFFSLAKGIIIQMPNL